MKSDPHAAHVIVRERLYSWRAVFLKVEASSHDLVEAHVQYKLLELLARPLSPCFMLNLPPL
jgi:hypothetical protein